MTAIARTASNTDFAIALLVVSSILWGGSFVSVKIGLKYVNAYDFAFLRMAIASAILVSALGLRGGMKASVLKEVSLWMLGLLNGVAFALQYVGLVFTSAGKAALLVNLNIVIVALLSWRVFRERFGLSKMFGVALGVTGGALIATNGNLSTLFQGEMFGDLLVFSAGLVWAFFIVLNKWVLTRVEGGSHSDFCCGDVGDCCRSHAVCGSLWGVERWCSVRCWLGLGGLHGNCVHGAAVWFVDFGAEGCYSNDGISSGDA